jgi:hypothetical protein
VVVTLVELRALPREELVRRHHTLAKLKWHWNVDAPWRRDLPAERPEGT